MRIEYLIIKQGVFEKRFDFSNGNTLVYSKANSVGKTTLLRTLLYSLGFKIPGTKLFPIEKFEYETTLKTDTDRTIRLNRRFSDFVVLEENDNVQTYCLPDQLDQLHAILFNTEDVNILDNILGAFYLDQEKGWTLLNRGVVIGSIHFNLEEFIQGLSGRDCSELKRKEAQLLKELNKYEQISNVTKYKETLEKADGSLLRETLDDELDAQIELRQIELNYAKKELYRIDNVLKSNRQFKTYVNEMKLMVKTPQGEVVQVTSDNLLDFNDTIEYLVAKRRIQAVEVNRLSSLIEKLKKDKKKNDNSLFTVETIGDAFDEMVQQFPYGYLKIEQIKKGIQKELKEVRKQITLRTSYNNEVLNSLYKNVIKYAAELGVGDGTSMKLNYLFTSNLKVLSGALLHKTVFSFRLAYILEVKKLLDVTLPIILDSPSGKEVDASNIELMVNILKRDFSDHQIIISSIFEYDLPDLHKIELYGRLLD